MNQTKKRLSIINLAISITDIETIQLQISKLRLLHADAKIQEIISVLQEESYAKSQGLITAYIEAPTEEVIQRASQETAPSISKEDQAIIDEFQLFVTADKKEKPQVVDIDINDYYEEEIKITKQTNQIDFDSLLNIDPKDVLTDNITLDISDNLDIENNQDTFFEFDIKKMKPVTLDTTSIPKDTFFDTEASTVPEVENLKQEEEMLFVKQEKTIKEKNVKEKTIVEKEIDTSFPTLQVKKLKKKSSYNPIPDIAQKLVSLKKQYPPVQKTYEKFTTVEELLNKVSKEGYSEKEIEEIFSYIRKLIEKTHYTEAAQLLLVSASTESKFGQLMLARELFKGVLLQKNIPEAFELMKALATEDYPEALCDLGQFYENAIGTTQNKMKAEELYKEATKSGIKRAKKHYTRLKKQNKGFFKN